MVLKHVAVGDPVDIQASTWNAMIDAAIANQQKLPRINIQQQGAEEPRTTVMVQNNTGGDLDYGECLMLGTPIIDPTANVNEFRNRIGFIGTTPGPANRNGSAVVLGGIPDGSIGLAVTGGIVAAQVNITDTNLSRCDAVDASTQLITRLEGAHEILWAEAGTGVKWCWVRVGRPRNVTAAGKTVANVTAGGSGTVRIYKAGVDTGYDQSDVQLDWMHGDQDISADKEVLIEWFPGENLWRFVGAECEDPGGGGGNAELLINLDNTVDWDVDVNGTNAILTLSDPTGGAASGLTFEMTPIQNALPNQNLTLTVKQDAEGGHSLEFPPANYFWPYGTPAIEPYPSAEELFALRTREDGQGQYWSCAVPADLNADRRYIDPDHVRSLSAVDASIVSTGKGPTISDGANGLDDNTGTFVTLNQDTVVQNAVQEWAVRVEFNAPISPYTFSAVGLTGASFVSASRYPSDVKIYFYSGQNGDGEVVRVETIDPAVFWPNGVTSQTEVYAALTPYVGPFQSVEFWFMFFGRNADVGDLTFSRARVAERPGTLR